MRRCSRCNGKIEMWQAFWRFDVTGRDLEAQDPLCDGCLVQLLQSGERLFGLFIRVQGEECEEVE